MRVRLAGDRTAHAISGVTLRVHARGVRSAADRPSESRSLGSASQLGGAGRSVALAAVGGGDQSAKVGSARWGTPGAALSSRNVSELRCRFARRASDDALESLDNRETAAAPNRAGAIVPPRSASLRMASVLQPAILTLLSAAWIGLELWVATRVGLWNTSLTKDAALWTVVSAGVLAFHAIQKASDTGSFRNTARGTLRVAVFVEFFLNLYVLSHAVCGCRLVDDGGLYRFQAGIPVKALCQGVLSLIVLALVGYTVGQMYLCWDHIDRSSLLLELVLPIWLTIGLLPFPECPSGI